VRISKETGLPALLASVVTMIPVLGVVWFVVQPFLKNSISVALADEIKQAVQQEVTPIKGGISVIIMSNIVKLKKEIAQLERLRAADPAKWTAEQADQLVDKYNELEAQQMALMALK
jgi:sensor domain CHASE-containing protein